jgi:hypothetical protein
MAKASRVAARQAQNLAEIAEQLARVEQKLDAALTALASSSAAGGKKKPAGKPAEVADEDQEA